MRKITFLCSLIITSKVFCQESLDSTQILQPVLIQAYSTNRELLEVPASVSVLTNTELTRFSPASIVSAVNTLPGVRMEERSPGSYRFSIRGSLLRSPFGVRNVKVYWNGIPLTDAGGNTYLNLLDFNAIGGIEVIKGPGGSLYGAGTGGVVLINSPSIQKDQIEFSVLGGSYGLHREQLTAQIHSEKVNVRIGYAHQQSDGYRDQTSMRRDALNADLTIPLSSSTTLSTTLLYTDLRYETPGALTKAEYDTEPSQARPPAGMSRGAEEQQATVFNQSPFAGVSLEHEWSQYWSSKVSLFSSYADFENPAIRNYEIRKETNLGARNENTYQFGKHSIKGKLTTGAEYQYSKSPIAVYNNDFGTRGDLQTNDEISSRLFLLFTQLELQLPLNFVLTAGASINFTNVSFERTYPSLVMSERKLEPSLSPRVALLNKITPAMSIYVSASRGFSPPSVAELFPSRAIFDLQIQPEYGNNFELGLRGSKLWNNFSYDIALYKFNLENTLVVRRDATLPGEPDYFVNAGSTNQKGIEAFVSWSPVENASTVVSDFRLWNSYNYNDYRFNQYIQSTTDYQGNRLTGVSPVLNSAGLDIVFRRALYLNITGSYTDHTPLNDANTVFADEYFLLAARAGFRKTFARHYSVDVFAGVDNALDKKHSLGNDLNAFGDRYFNAAAPRNVFAGIRFSYSLAKR